VPGSEAYCCCFLLLLLLKMSVQVVLALPHLKGPGVPGEHICWVEVDLLVHSWVWNRHLDGTCSSITKQ
jgi:hypothetical protein